MFCACLVFLMQAGFAMLEAGSIRSKNVKNVLLKNLVDACVGAIIWYLVGYGIIGGGNDFIGEEKNGGFALEKMDDTDPSYKGYGYDWISFFFSYTFVVHWVWNGDGFLSAFNPDHILDAGNIDFAGSGVVHMTGGVAGLVGAAILKPRTGRFEDPTKFAAHSSPLQVLGTFLLWFGWYGFNGGSTLFINGWGTTAARVCVT